MTVHSDQVDSLSGSSGALQTADCGLPYNRVGIFISSSMRDEGDFSWKDYRSEIYKRLKGSPLFTPFVIENRASIEPSRSFYLHNVEQAGIVVATVREELRQGTNDEIRHALKCGKPLMLICIGTKRDSNTAALIREIERNDYCTYYLAKSAAISDLAEEVVSQLYRNAVDLLNMRLSQWRDDHDAETNISDSVRYAVPKAVISSFGDTVDLLASSYGYGVLGKRDKSENTYLSPLGNAIVSWLLNGDEFTVDAYVPTVQVAMKDSGVPSEVLRCRLKALDSFIRKEYEEALEQVREACELLPDKDSWLYGNCLIDMRNLAGYVAGAKWNAGSEAQHQLTQLSNPALFPLAAYFSNSALSQMLKAERKYSTRKPGSVIYDRTLSRVLNDLTSHAFVSFLYGSIASFNYSRVLIAYTLINYAHMYQDGDLIYEGLKLFVLGGEATEFNMQFNNGMKSFGNGIKTKADSLWFLSGKGIEALVPNMRCALVRHIAPYFSDAIIPTVEDYLCRDTDLFSRCRQEWLLAIDALKLRIDGKQLARVVTEILSKRMFITGLDIGHILRGIDYSSMPRDSIAIIADCLKCNASELIEAHVPPTAFAVVGNCVGEELVGRELLDSVDLITRNEYLEIVASEGEIWEAYLRELKQQFRENNNKGRYSQSGYNVSKALCRLIDSEDCSKYIEKLGKTLDSILEDIGEYKGYSGALNAPMAVLCKYVCALRSMGRDLPIGWVERIGKIKEDRYSSESLFPFLFDGKRVWKVRALALRVAAGVEDGILFLAEGFALGSYSRLEATAYLESLSWLVASFVIDDEFAPLVLGICEKASELEDVQSRREVLRCLSAYSKRWGLNSVSNIVSDFSRDPDDSVVFDVLGLCKTGAFGDHEFEREMLELLATDANWYVRRRASDSLSK